MTKRVTLYPYTSSSESEYQKIDTPITPSRLVKLISPAWLKHLHVMLLRNEWREKQRGEEMKEQCDSYLVSIIMRWF